MCKRLTQWCHDPETIWLADSPVHLLQQDYLYKASPTISQAVGCIGDLQVDHMSKSATDKGIVARLGLNKAILDRGWRSARLYKLAWKGRSAAGTLRTILAETKRTA